MPRRKGKKKTGQAPALTDEELLDMAIAQAKQERAQLKEKHELDRRKKAMERENLERQSQAERVASFSTAAAADLPHTSFMAPPQHPDEIEDNEYAESYKKMLQKPAGGGDERAGSAKERALYARRLRKWKRNGQRGKMPEAPRGNDGGAPLRDEFVSSASLQASHCSRYGSWVLRELMSRGILDAETRPSRFVLPFSFNIMGDKTLMNKKFVVNSPELVVILMLIDRVVYMRCVRHEQGLEGALADGSVDLACTPDNVLAVLEGGEPPRRAYAVDAPKDLKVLGKEFYSRGIPCHLALRDAPWPAGISFPVQ